MGDIVSLVELTNSLQQAITNSVGDHLISLAEGLVIEKVGDHAPWTPVNDYATPRTVVLSAAGRAAVNPKNNTVKAVDGVRDEHPEWDFGVYLTEREQAELAAWKGAQDDVPGNGQAPVGCFPEPLCYPDPARGPRYTGSAATDYGH